ncbi:MAG TPA: M23 family metallopeptidase, partial [Thermoanaerobaculia bacterium]|nr:M23 family metallopeptidase [Thermoanaerobaculia bacterium]
PTSPPLAAPLPGDTKVANPRPARAPAAVPATAAAPGSPAGPAGSAGTTTGTGGGPVDAIGGAFAPEGPALPTPGGPRRLAIPVAGIAAGELRDTYTESRGDHPHDAIDILSPRGRPVLAADDGRIEKLFYSQRGGITVYQFDPTATYAYYYAHLDAYAPGLAEGLDVRRGTVLGYVGTSGNAPPGAPHLHFQVFRLTPEKHWWQGQAINPYPYLAR